MDKTAIKNYAIYARNKLIQSAEDKAATIGIYEDKIVVPSSKGQDFEVYTSSIGANITLNKEEITQRENLIKKIHNDGYKETIEEVAYTWFNRIIAIRFMEVNDYLPSRVRVLSSENEGQKESDLMQSPFSVDFSYTQKERDLIISLKDQNKIDELFKVLFIKACNELSNNLPDLFEKTIDYTELLFDIRYNDPNDVIYKLVNEIPESNFNVEQEGQVEIIGWLYQYYNTEPKANVYARPKGKKIEKEDIPAVTQLFTPDWICKYMVENSLGRLWLESHNDPSLKSTYKYYLDEAQQDEDVQKQLDEIRNNRNLKLEEIKLIDPCMGSGHILVYAFDVFMGIYESEGWNPRDAAISILQNNLYGLDIDKRAYQLSYFALMMKARQYNRRILAPSNEEERVKPNVFEIKESNNIYRDLLTGTSVNQQAKDDFTSLLNQMHDAKEYGSLLEVKPIDFDNLRLALQNQELAMFDTVIKEDIIPLIDCAKLLSRQYDVVVTNPPYMGSSGMDKKLSDYVKKNYPNTKSDMSTIMMEKSLSICKQYGFMSMINIPAWMFISSYEQMRKDIVLKNNIINMIHLGRGIFGSDFGTTSFVIQKNDTKNYQALYLRLFDKQGSVESIETKEKLFKKKFGKHYAKKEIFDEIPSSPIAYWISNGFVNAFKNGRPLSPVAKPCAGLQTGDNGRFLRQWFEVAIDNVGFDAISTDDALTRARRWFPYNKGGEFRKWYGNNDYVVNWENDGFEIKHFTNENGKLRSRPQNVNQYFKECGSWSLVTSSATAFRYKPKGFIFDVAGMSFFTDKHLNYYIGFCNTKIAYEILKIIAPTINFQAGDIAKLPIIINKNQITNVETLVQDNINISKNDWDSFEISWDFETHPFVRLQKTLWDATSVGCTMSHYYGKPIEVSSTLELCYLLWQGECNERFNTLKANEEELNRIFIDIYGLQDELTSDVEDKDVTVRKADELRDIKSFISYAVGCMFGRYSLDKDGLAYAGGDFNMDDYHIFKPDMDNIIPISEVGYFEDDITSRFIKFISKVFGDDALQDNLAYIAKVLGGKGTPEEVIRNYFINEFYKDHVKMYQKRPIYWLFDSGKNNGFKALIYMHRYNADTVSNVRTEYLHKFQNTYEVLIKDDEYIMDHSDNKAEVTKARKHKENLEKKLAETRIYDQALAHIANKRIDIDLDDGVKVNYEKFQNVEVINEGSKAIKVNLLGKIK